MYYMNGNVLLVYSTVCCCADDYCNVKFHDPPDVTDDSKNETVDSVKNTTTHIYKNFPNHTTEGIIS